MRSQYIRDCSLEGIVVKRGLWYRGDCRIEGIAG